LIQILTGSVNGPPQLSVAVADVGDEGTHEFTVTLAGIVITGGVVSTIVNVAVAVAVFPDRSVAVNVTVETPVFPQRSVNAAFPLLLHATPPHPSVATDDACAFNQFL